MASRYHTVCDGVRCKTLRSLDVTSWRTIRAPAELLSKKENVDRLLASLRDMSEGRVTDLGSLKKRELSAK